jgi:hypothetical protein
MKRRPTTAAVLAATLGVALAAGARAADGGSEGVPGVADPPADASGPDKVCLARLRDLKVDFLEWPTRGVTTPIRIIGALGPLRLVPRGAGPPAAARSGVQAVMDCALALALLDAAPLFQQMGIRDLFYSGIYQYRSRRGSTKLSEHAHGLAVDVHVFGTTDGVTYDVARDFEKGVGVWAVTSQEACVGAPATPAGRFLRQLACGLRASSAFREIITADDNADHANHFHIEAFKDALSRAKAILAHREPIIDD